MLMPPQKWYKLKIQRQKKAEVDSYVYMHQVKLQMSDAFAGIPYQSFESNCGCSNLPSSSLGHSRESEEDG